MRRASSWFDAPGLGSERQFAAGLWPANASDVAATAGAAGNRAAPRLCRTFQTRQLDDADTYIRTFGTVVHAPAGRGRIAAAEALTFAHPSPPPNCARGKVVAFSCQGSECEAACFQLTDCRTQGQLVACSNATAAAAACYASFTNATQAALRLKLPGRRFVRVDAYLELASRATLVRQVWNQVPFSVAAVAEVAGRTCAVCVSPLNNYLVIRTRPGETASDFAIEDAIRLGHQFGCAREPLLSRIAVLAASDGHAHAKFFTCAAREHPSAPLTGLAVLALAAQRLGWGSLQSQARIGTKAGSMLLPTVAFITASAATVAFPALAVALGSPVAHPSPPGSP